jgi:hypothetical protein
MSRYHLPKGLAFAKLQLQYSYDLFSSLLRICFFITTQIHLTTYNKWPKNWTHLQRLLEFDEGGKQLFSS